MEPGLEQIPSTPYESPSNAARLRAFAEECVNSSGNGSPIEAVFDCELCNGLGHRPFVHQTCSRCDGLGFAMNMQGEEVSGHKLRGILEAEIVYKERHDPAAHTLQ